MFSACPAGIPWLLLAWTFLRPRLLVRCLRSVLVNRCWFSNRQGSERCVTGPRGDLLWLLHFESRVTGTCFRRWSCVVLACVSRATCLSHRFLGVGGDCCRVRGCCHDEEEVESSLSCGLLELCLSFGFPSWNLRVLCLSVETFDNKGKSLAVASNSWTPRSCSGMIRGSSTASPR